MPIDSHILTHHWREFLERSSAERAAALWVSTQGEGAPDSQGARARLHEDLGPDALTSISHSAGALVAVGLTSGAGGGFATVPGTGVASATGSAPRILGIGVDLERADRKTSPGFQNRILAPDENARGMGALEHFMIKEACFKSNPVNAGTVITQYALMAWSPELEEGEMSFEGDSSLRFRFKLLLLEGWRIAFAECSKQG